jgi:hypothetical protein
MPLPPRPPEKTVTRRAIADEPAEMSVRWAIAEALCRFPNWRLLAINGPK